MSLMMCEGKYVGRDEIATVPTPAGTDSWHPVPHLDVIDAVTEVVKAHNWQIVNEQFGLAREGQRMFGVMRCSNLAFGGTMVLKRRHTSRIELDDLVLTAVDELEMEFLNLETVSEDLKLHEVNADEARAVIVRAAEVGAVNSCDIVPIFREFQKPCHEEFTEPTRWSLLNAFTEHAKKYSPGRADICYRGLTRLFGLDGNQSELWTR